MSYGKIFPHWRAAAGQTWSDYVDHAFVRGLNDGTLPERAYLHYLVQDYVFLMHFARAWALAITKAETLEEMHLCARTVNGLINEELTLHVKTCAAAGISEAELFEAEERQENLAYTRYVMDAGHSGDLLDILAALAPCVMGYGEISTRMTKTATSDKYQDWIATYSGTEYQELCGSVGTLIDHATQRRLGDSPQSIPRWGVLCERFQTATRLEVGFWDMGLSP